MDYDKCAALFYGQQSPARDGRGEAAAIEDAPQADAEASGDSLDDIDVGSFDFSFMDETPKNPASLLTVSTSISNSPFQLQVSQVHTLAEPLIYSSHQSYNNLE